MLIDLRFFFKWGVGVVVGGVVERKMALKMMRKKNDLIFCN